jgi:SAM-dependent methyltransferase
MNDHDLSNFQTDAQTTYAGSAELWVNEQCLVRYCHHVASMAVGGLRGAKSVMEFGAGIGTLAGRFEAMTGIKPECVEIDPSLKTVLTERGFNCYTSLEGVNSRFDGVYSSNVLEHIEADVDAMRRIHATLRPGGSLALYLPASRAIYNDLDRHVGHYRRYSAKELGEKLRDAGFEVVSMEYADCIGFFAWWIMGWKKATAASTLASRKQLRLYDRFVFPLSCLCDRLGCRYLFGKNIYALAVRR